MSSFFGDRALAHQCLVVQSAQLIGKFHKIWYALKVNSRDVPCCTALGDHRQELNLPDRNMQCRLQLPSDRVALQHSDPFFDQRMRPDRSI